ncbi:hypothetical protein [Peribacillus sp. SI8-4]|uniref:hypothetical protein n=1 Tax=Peribacillus sp. SI8-4 TaxID=3048009 RepID=UPI0025570FBA|nr:hypothetical protein [Peribacillus sp. SI8-4]
MKSKYPVLITLLLIGLTIPNEADAEWSITDEGLADDQLNAAQTFTIAEKVKDVLMLHVVRGGGAEFRFY